MSPSPLRRDLLLNFGTLFAAAVLVAGIAVWAVLPALETVPVILLFVLVLVVADLAVLFVFGGAFLRRRLVAPVEALADDARRIADGAYHHRIQPSDSLELESVRQSVNAMADRLIEDQRLLAENVASLDRTNRELVRARDQVIQTARLASVGTLAAGIAHEVGNPLGAIMGFADVARKRAKAADADTEMLDAIRDEANRIDRIVRGLLEYARPKQEEAGPMAPGEVLVGVRQLLENQGKLEEVEDQWNLDVRVAPVVMEPHRLEQVLVNLFLNAVHALRGHPEPSIRVSLDREAGALEALPARREDDPPGINYMHRRRVSRDDGGRGVDTLFTAPEIVLIRVADNGPGVPESDRESIFDPFFTTKEPGDGTGLGLSICARLVEGMGGRIEVGESDMGGALFTIRLPGHPGEDEAGPDTPSDERSHQPHSA